MLKKDYSFIKLLVSIKNNNLFLIISNISILVFKKK